MALIVNHTPKNVNHAHQDIIPKKALLLNAYHVLKEHSRVRRVVSFVKSVYQEVSLSKDRQCVPHVLVDHMLHHQEHPIVALYVKREHIKTKKVAHCVNLVL